MRYINLLLTLTLTLTRRALDHMTSVTVVGCVVKPLRLLIFIFLIIVVVITRIKVITFTVILTSHITHVTNASNNTIQY